MYNTLENIKNLLETNMFSGVIGTILITFFSPIIISVIKLSKINLPNEELLFWSNASKFFRGILMLLMLMFITMTLVVTLVFLQPENQSQWIIIYLGVIMFSPYSYIPLYCMIIFVILFSYLVIFLKKFTLFLFKFIKPSILSWIVRTHRIVLLIYLMFLTLYYFLISYVYLYNLRVPSVDTTFGKTSYEFIPELSLVFVIIAVPVISIGSFIQRKNIYLNIKMRDGIEHFRKHLVNPNLGGYMLLSDTKNTDDENKMMVPRNDIVNISYIYVNTLFEQEQITFEEFNEQSTTSSKLVLESHFNDDEKALIRSLARKSRTDYYRE
ncbi:hypothetical protein [Cohnella abietis]|uniref:Uncharacterized protein n=1 Tax=Cohnella abietis TaxID=2507935 RepID=A0A3T1D688_9BACL|nr:hypothetical protein [Cohnella abietis]BBI33597.1 hypothetical protein KCTCHS21_29960 [Cohnella abietis]